jgi:hypothetical protein
MRAGVPLGCPQTGPMVVAYRNIARKRHEERDHSRPVGILLSALAKLRPPKSGSQPQTPLMPRR